MKLLRVIPMVIKQGELPISYNHTGNSPSCRQRAFIQQLIKTDAEEHNQHWSSSGNPVEERGEKLYRLGRESRSSQGNTETTNLGSSELTEYGTTVGGLHGTGLAPLHMNDSNVAWSTCETLGSGNRTLP